MKRLGRLEFVVLIINTLAFLSWICWLVFFARNKFYSQDGIMLYFPCIPIFFVYIFVFTNNDEDDGNSDSSNAADN